MKENHINEMQLQRRQMYVMFDTVTQTTSAIFEQLNDKAAIRAVKKMPQPPTDDYILVRVGIIDSMGFIEAERVELSLEEENG